MIKFSNSLGRKTIIVIFIFLQGVISIGHSFMPNVWAFGLFRVLSPMSNVRLILFFFKSGLIFQQVCFLTSMIYSIEVVGPSKRAFSGTFLETIFVIGAIATSGLGFLGNDKNEAKLNI